VDGNVMSGDEFQVEVATATAQVLVEVTDDVEPDVIEIEPVSVVDTTAELLGRAKPRAPRARAGRTGVAAAPSAPRTRSAVAGARKTGGAKKPAPAGGKRSPSRARKPAVDKSDDNFGNR
jgi:hypothetical protein